MSLRLEYVTTPADQIAKLDRFASGSLVSRRFLIFAYFAICALAWFSAILFYVKQGDRNFGYLGYAAFAAVLTISLPWLYRRYQRSFFKSILTEETLCGLVGPTTLTLDEHHIEEVGPILTAKVAWADVLRIEQTPDRTLIFLAPLIAIVIPSSAFPDTAAREEFERTLNDRFQGTRPTKIDV